jgi:hypothetical protein
MGWFGEIKKNSNIFIWLEILGFYRQTLLIMVIELSGVQFGLNSNAWLQNRNIVMTSLISVQIALHSVQFPLYYIHFEILNIFVNRKRFCLQKTHFRYLPAECCSIATISEQDELSFISFVYKYVQILQKSLRNKDIYKE